MLLRLEAAINIFALFRHTLAMICIHLWIRLDICHCLMHTGRRQTSYQGGMCPEMLASATGGAGEW